MENERDQTDLSLLQIFVSICNYHRLKLILKTYISVCCQNCNCFSSNNNKYNALVEINKLNLQCICNRFIFIYRVKRPLARSLLYLINIERL